MVKKDLNIPLEDCGALENNSARVLYLSHDGLMEPLSQSQVWQYLRDLARHHEITLITYEKKQDWFDVNRRSALLKEVALSGIHWFPLRYHKSPKVLASLIDLGSCFFVGAYLTLRYRINIVHARNAPFTLIAMALKFIFGPRFVFDMRGFWADERVDGGLWKKGGIIYKINKWLEKLYFLSADTVVVLTHAAKREISNFDYLKNKNVKIEIITTCTNLGLFRRNASGAIIEGRSFTLGYLGNVGTWYLFDPALMFFKLLKECNPKARMLIINDGQHEFIRSRLRALDIEDSCVELKSALFVSTPEEICRMDAAVYFIKPVFSKKSSMPTKLGELFGCGVPCVTNRGIGDVDMIVDQEKVGVLLSDLGPNELRKAVEDLMELTEDREISNRCVRAAEKFFSLDRGVTAYNKIYSNLIS